MHSHTIGEPSDICVAVYKQAVSKKVYTGSLKSPTKILLS